MLSALRSAFGFLTVIGKRGSLPTNRTSWFFPIVGLVVGGTVGLVRWGAGNVWSPLVAGVLAVTADLALTGMLHLDGLADSADGLLPHMDRDRRLTVMRTPDVGAFGLGVCVVVLLLRVATLAELDLHGWRVVAACAAIWCAARSMMAVAMAVIPNARVGSLADVFGRSRVGAWGLAPAVALATWSLGAARGLATMAVVVICAAAVGALAKRRVGGITGDTLGAQTLFAETIALLSAAARP